MGRVASLMMCAVLLGGLTGTASADPQGRGRKRPKPAPAADRGDGVRTDLSVRVVFASADVKLLRTHYAPRYRNLPPGLQKKVARGGELPPGWQKKFEPFPAEVERRLSPLPDGHRRGVIDGHAVIYDARTQVVVDVAVLF